MDSISIPNEDDFRKWIREALKEYLEATPIKKDTIADLPQVEPLLSRKEIAGIFRISLVTLHDWMKQGLPNHKLGGRVYFLQKEVMEYIRANSR